MNRKNWSHDRYRSFDFTTIPSGKDKMVVHSQRSGKSKLLSPFQLQILRSCQKFKTLTAHSEHFCQQRMHEQLKNRKGLLGNLFRSLLRFASREGIKLPVREKEINQFRQQLQEWTEEGLLVSESELLREINALSQQNNGFVASEANKITVMGIPTCGRPETLRRCLDSFTGNFNRYGRNPDILILDDSRDEADRQKNRSVLRGLSDRYDGESYYMDRSRREALGEAVARRAGIEPEVMEFAFMGHPSCNRSEGGCRNTFLLLSRGRLALQTDDDTICQVAQPPDTNNNITLTSHRSSDSYWFFQSYKETMGAVNVNDTDFLGLHEQMVGKHPAEVITPFMENGHRLNLENMQPAFLQNMNQDNAGIRMSLVGPAGDTCLFTDLYRLFLKGESLHRLLYPKEEYPWHLSTRQVIRSVIQPTITDFPRCIGMNFAIDNRSLLPPFMPVQARCDGIFGDLLAVCYPGAFSGNLPYVLAHDPPKERSRTVDDLFSLLEIIRVNDIIAELIYYSKSWLNADNPEENMLTLGQFLKNLGNYPQEDFEKKIRQIYSSSISRKIQLVEQHLLSHCDRPEYWLNHLQRYNNVLTESLLNSNFLVPDDIDNPSSGDRQDFQEIVSLFGRLLMHWPDIYRAMDSFSEDEILKYVTRVEKEVHG